MNINHALTALNQGILICNKQGKIIYFNEEYASYIGCTLDEARGKYLKELRPNAIALEVLKTRIPVEGILHNEGDTPYYASVYPIIENDSIQGTISIVTSMTQHHSTVHKPQTLAERVREYEKEEILLTLAKYANTTEGKKQAASELGISLATLYNKLNDK